VEAAVDWLLIIFLRRFVRRGTLTVTTASGRSCTFGDGAGPRLAVRFTTAGTQAAVLFDPELKLGEAYMDGTFVVEQGSIAEVLAFLLAQERLAGKGWALPRVLRYLFRRLQQFNLRSRARQNVAHHYDLDGRLYSLFLDGDQQYSCAYFESPDQSLDDAQLAKKRHLAAKLRVKPGASVLDIGCGWGGLALYLAEIAGAWTIATSAASSTGSYRSACSSMSASGSMTLTSKNARNSSPMTASSFCTRSGAPALLA
jgi:cyclopropane-fatty-acyl-phospholipid synthase